jgi:hypothetical protein
LAKPRNNGRVTEQSQGERGIGLHGAVGVGQQLQQGCAGRAVANTPQRERRVPANERIGLMGSIAKEQAVVAPGVLRREDVSERFDHRFLLLRLLRAGGPRGSNKTTDARDQPRA